MYALAHAFFDVSGESIVSVDSGSLVVNGLSGIADVGNTVVDVSTFVIIIVTRTIGCAV